MDRRGLFVAGVFASATWTMPLQPLEVFGQPTEKFPTRGFARAVETRPQAFPHRIWAACDFEAQTPDYGWFGPQVTTNLDLYPGNTAALGVTAKPYGQFSALMTGINPVPGPRMGKVNKLFCRYFLKGTDTATFQHFSLTRNDNHHIHVSGLTQDRWSEVTLNFTRDALRNDGSDEAFQEGERMDDFKIFVGKPADGEPYELLLDDLVFFADNPALPVESEPFPNRVILQAAFDTGIDGASRPKYWPGEFDIVTREAPAGSYWGVAKAVPRGDDGSKWIRLEIKPPRAVGAQTKLRFRYHLTGTRAMTVQIFDATDQDNRHIHLSELESGTWTFCYLDFTHEARRNDGASTSFSAGHIVDDLFFFVRPADAGDVHLFIDEVTLFDAGTNERDARPSAVSPRLPLRP